MNYAIIRTAKIKTMGNLSSSAGHNFRERDTPNADPARTHLNTTKGAQSVDEVLAAVRARLNTVPTVRKNGVLVLEYFVGASPEWFAEQTPEAREAYFDDTEKWLQERHGADNVVTFTRQYDETSPHVCAYVVPIDPKGRLNAAHFQDGRKKMHALQTDFAADVGKVRGLERGIEGSKAEHVSIKKHYALVNEPFEPLPEVVTKMPPKLPPEPKKPGLLAGSAAKNEYQRTQAKRATDQIAWEAQRKAHLAERKAERDAAVATAKRHQAQAREAAALKIEVRQLKRANGEYAKRIVKLLRLQSIVDLFTPAEISKARERKQIQEAEKAHQEELARSRAAAEAKEAARLASIEAEAAKRVTGVQKLLQRGGAEHTFGVLAAAALRDVGDDALLVNWKEVENKTIQAAIGKNGQSAENVKKVILKNSPRLADPAMHSEVVTLIDRVGPQLEAKFQLDRTQRSGNRLGR